MPIHRFPMMLQEYYVGRMRETFRKRDRELKAIRTRADALRYRDKVRRSIRACFGRLPARTLLKSRVIGVKDYGDFAVERVLFESRPGFLVSANLYMPRPPRAGKVPGVLFPCGHSANGKAHPIYVKACIRMARAGCAVLNYDPINQGERDLYSMETARSRPTRLSPCQGHNMLGKQLDALGEWFGTWRLWDGMRGVDYLLTRPEIDSDSIAVAGQSGGGTMSSIIWAADHRLKTVASSCWTTSMLSDIENGMPTDSEQCPPGFLARGLNKIDLFISRAGEPALLLGQEEDFFDDRGLRNGYRELLRIHRLLGGERSLCSLHISPGIHCFSDAGQLRMIRFLKRVLKCKGKATDQESPTLEEAQLAVTPRCDVNRFGSRPAGELVAELARSICRKRSKPRKEKVPGLVRRALRIKKPRQRPHHRRLFHSAQKRKGTTQDVFRFIVESEPGIQCVLRHVCRGKTRFRMSPAREVSLYLPNLCSQAELERRSVLRGTGDYWILDVRGLGESSYRTDDPLSAYGHDYMHSVHAMMYGETLLGDRVFDVLNSLAALRGEGAERVHLVGRGQGAILALLAGVTDPGVTTVTSMGAPESIEKMVSTPLNYWPAVNFPRGILSQFDLPDVRRALGRRLVKDTCGAHGGFAP